MVIPDLPVRKYSNGRNATLAGVELYVSTIVYYKHSMSPASDHIYETPNSNILFYPLSR